LMAKVARINFRYLNAWRTNKIEHYFSSPGNVRSRSHTKRYGDRVRPYHFVPLKSLTFPHIPTVSPRWGWWKFGENFENRLRFDKVTESLKFKGGNFFETV